MEYKLTGSLSLCYFLVVYWIAEMEVKIVESTDLWLPKLHFPLPCSVQYCLWVIMISLIGYSGILYNRIVLQYLLSSLNVALLPASLQRFLSCLHS